MNKQRIKFYGEVTVPLPEEKMAVDRVKKLVGGMTTPFDIYGNEEDKPMYNVWPDTERNNNE